MGLPPPEASTAQSASEKNAVANLYESVRSAWEAGPRAFLAIWGRVIFSSLFGYALLFGAGVGLTMAIGEIFAIGWHSAWKTYRIEWILSPLFGPLILFTFISSVLAFDFVTGRIKRQKWIIIVGTPVALAVVLVFGGYLTAREDNPMLGSQTANLDALTKTAGDQSHVLGEMSESGQKLLSQLNATQGDLDSAKKQLSATLSNFDMQRQAAGQVTEELKRLDARQKQIALQAEELERILEGEQPLTRRDMQRANLQGLISGFLIGFLTSFLASMAHHRLIGKAKSIATSG